jgi:hypothetical protein
MKIRNGFVSNSSTSSFLIVGIKGKIKKEKNDDYEAWEKLFTDIKLDYLPNEGPWYFGRVIFDNPDDSGSEGVQEVDTVKVTKSLKKLLEEHISVLSEYIDSDFKVKVYAGTRSC